MVMNLYYGYWLAAYGDALRLARPDKRAPAEAGLHAAIQAAEAGRLTTAEFTAVRDAILRAIDDDTDEGDAHAE